MREIRFRAWDEEEKFMLQDIQSMYDGGCNHKETEERYGWISCFDSFIDNDNYVVMQYTGLKDKNGTEIYEGDIVKTKHNNEVLIKWIKTRFYPCRQGKTGQYNKVTNWDCVTRGEVIGNIYENPELLK